MKHWEFREQGNLDPNEAAGLWPQLEQEHAFHASCKACHQVLLPGSRSSDNPNQNP
jgi:hypothetical protein